VTAKRRPPRFARSQPSTSSPIPAESRVFELVEYHDDGCAGALLCQKRLAEIALGGHVQFAAEGQPGGAVHLTAPLDAEVPSASVTI